MNKFTIITINYNNKVGLQKTIKSVFDQSFGDYEYIIIDGGSTDGSEEVIEQCAARLSYWVSESDRVSIMRCTKELRRLMANIWCL